MDVEYSRVGDFLILHYHLNRREEPLWRDCAAMEVPDSLVRKLALFRYSAGSRPIATDCSSRRAGSACFSAGEPCPARHTRSPKESVLTEIDADLENIAAAIEQAIAPLPSHAEALGAMVAREAA